MVDEDVVVDKLRYINEYTNDLKQMRGVSKMEYTEDVVLQRAVERTFIKNKENTRAFRRGMNPTTPPQPTVDGKAGYSTDSKYQPSQEKRV